jgi:hypothetical protein
MSEKAESSEELFDAVERFVAFTSFEELQDAVERFATFIQASI